MNRKLIRPYLADYKKKMKSTSSNKKFYPPFETYAENYYYLKQMKKKTPIAVVFVNGERIDGHIQWYDKNCIKLNRDNAVNLLIYKNRIKYLYKLEEKDKTRS